METGDQFPWELLKADCLRLVCVQLVDASSDGQKSFKPARKEEMVAFLRDVHERGVIKALEDVVELPRKAIDSPQASPSKRKSVHVDDNDDDNYEEEDAEGDSDDDENKNGEGYYNTRYKGVKRVKVHGFSPDRQEPKPKRKVGRPRKSAPEGEVAVVERRKRGRPRTSNVGGEQIKVSKGKEKSLENGDAAVGEVMTTPSISKRPRGRPRKIVTTAESNGTAKKPLHSANNAPMSKDSGREVFDGIVLMKRNKNRKEGEAVGDDLGGGEAPNEEMDGFEEDAVLAAVNGDAQGDLSSLGGSNKENEQISATYTPDPEEDADGEFEADAEVVV